MKKSLVLAGLAATAMSLGATPAGATALDYPYAVDQNGTAIPCGFVASQGADGRWVATVGNCHDYGIQRRIQYVVGSPTNCYSFLPGRGYTSPRTIYQPTGISSC
jgi:hypothetical protein